MSLSTQTAQADEAGFFERPRPVAVMFGSFVLLFVPLLCLVCFQPESTVTHTLLLAHAVGLGLTHFLITFAVYLESGHRDYFGSTRRNRLTYFYVPIAIVLLFALASLLDVRTRFPLAAALALSVLRFFDFFHVGRQSFGVLQLFRGVRGSPRTRALDNGLFVGLAGAQWLTFATGGSFDRRAPWSVAAVVALAGCYATIVASHASEPPGLGAARERRAFAYLTMQLIAGACAVYDTRFYLLGLTLHYVEYHLLMQRRCFGARLDAARLSDRFAERVRSRPVVFYLLLAGLAVLVQQLSTPFGDATSSQRYVHVFDGIFLAHYFVEAFLWRLREPFYRAHVAPLYQGSNRDAALSARRAPELAA